MMKNTKKNMFKQQEHRSFMDWFIAAPAKITIIGHQIELKMHGKGMKGLHDVGQALIEATLKQREEEYMKTNTGVYGRSTYTLGI